jgi:bis(5'-nucleosyl)-tetraphosphatase (symmetrical)
MATYAIGDVQGCFEELLGLVKLIDFAPANDRLAFVGDLVNRGPYSLETLRWVVAHQDVVDCVLGNHDLHLLAVACGVGKQKGQDTLSDILLAPDRDVLLSWLRQQPLVRTLGAHVLVHAGLLPAWTADHALSLSREVSSMLAGSRYIEFMSHMYGNKPRCWDDALSGWDRLRFVVNACTRMRVLADGGVLDFGFKGELPEIPPGLVAWFDAPTKTPRSHRIIYGHWSALGLRISDRSIGLDTGCVWGGALTAYRLEDGEVFQVPSLQPLTTEWS